MSLSCADVVEVLTERLEQAGYRFHNGNAETGEVVDDESGEHCWFTWCVDGTDIEVGPPDDGPLQSLCSAMDHWFENAKIPLHKVGD